MKQFPQGIFQTLDWLVKQVDRLKYQIANLPEPPVNGGPEPLTSVTVDGFTVQGSGVSGNPLKSNLSTAYYQNSTSTLNLVSGSTFHYVDADPFAIATTCTINDSNLTLEEGRRLIIANNSGFDANVTGTSNLPVPNGTLQIGKTAEFVCILNPFAALPQLQWFLINVY